MKKIFTGSDDAENYYVHSLLEAEAIRSAILGGNLAIGRGSLPLTEDTLSSVWVHPEDFTQAQKIIDEYNNTTKYLAEIAKSGPWVCPNCGKNLEAQFTICWNCQTTRPIESDEKENN